MDFAIENLTSDRNTIFIVQDETEQDNVFEVKNKIDYNPQCKEATEVLTEEINQDINIIISEFKAKEEIKGEDSCLDDNKTTSFEYKNKIIVVKGTNCSENINSKEAMKYRSYEGCTKNIHVPAIITEKEVKKEKPDYPSNHTTPKAEIKEEISLKDRLSNLNRLVGEVIKCTTYGQNVDINISTPEIKIKKEIKSEENDLVRNIYTNKNYVKEEIIDEKDYNYKNDYTSFSKNEELRKIINEGKDMNVDGLGIGKTMDTEFQCEIKRNIEEDNGLTRSGSTHGFGSEITKEIKCSFTSVSLKHELNDEGENYNSPFPGKTEYSHSPLPLPVSKDSHYTDIKLLQKPVVLLVDLKLKNIPLNEIHSSLDRGKKSGNVYQNLDDYGNEKEKNTESLNVTEFHFDINKERVDGNGFYRCSLCSFKTVYRASLISHWLIHSKKREFKCDLCKYTAKRKSDLKEHILRHNMTYPFKCNFCSYKGKKKQYFDSHMLRHTNPDLFKCSTCDKRFTTKDNLTSHVKYVHERAKPIFNCDLCNFICNRKSTLTTHVKFVHKKTEIHKCTSCSYSTARKGDLSKHMMKHTGIKPYGCAHCSFKSTNSGTLNAHMRVHTGERPFMCTLCDKSFKMKGTLKDHMLTHNKFKEFSCSKCDYSTNNQNQLKKHTRIHMREKPYKCSSCSYKSKTNHGLKTHMKFHTGECINCTFCDYKTPFMTNMKSHIQTHEGIRLFKCDLCGFAARSKQNLENHFGSEHYENKPRKRHSRQKGRNFPCDVCSFVATSFGYLRNHLKLKHGIVNL